jgi:Fur family ferric uptake transcriptional regulator
MIASNQSSHPLGGVKEAGRAVSPLELACARLKAAGMRITQPRIAILEALIRRDSPASIEQLHSELASDSCDLVTVYRCLAVYEELGLVRRCFFHNGTSLYEINLSDTRHHHIVCKACGKVERIDFDLTQGIERVLHERGYDQVTHMIEFFGICPACKKKVAAADPVLGATAR